jgi:hypothetical protein
MTRNGTQPAAVVVCSGCDKGMDFCSCCDREDCPVCICYSCLTVELRVSLPQPHEHGG